MARTSIFAFGTATLGLLLASCSGGTLGQSPSSLPSLSSDGAQTVSDAADAMIAHRTGSENAKAGVDAAMAIGTRVSMLGALAGDDLASAFRPAVRRGRSPNGHCVNGAEFFAPDRNNDPDSTETLLFYDTQCTQLALDDVRLWSSTGAHSETVNRTDSFYQAGSSAAAAVASTTSAISKAKFAPYGLPVFANGFVDDTSTQVTYGSSAVATGKAEFVMSPGARSLGSFCGDAAGYNPAGIASLDETFGLQGGIAGMRSTAGPFVTWTATPTGTAYSGAIGSLSIVDGTANTVCPIQTPQFTIAGGTSLGTFSLPLSVTFRRGLLANLTVINASLPSGDTLNVRTSNGRKTGFHPVISGVVRNGRSIVATFAVNAFGNGELAITSTGAQYKIVDWIVVQ